MLNVGGHSKGYKNRSLSLASVWEAPGVHRSDSESLNVGVASSRKTSNRRWDCSRILTSQVCTISVGHEKNGMKKVCGDNASRALGADSQEASFGVEASLTRVDTLVGATS